MATLYLICGLPGSGKTTLAKKIEASQTALRLCPDEWIESLLADVTNTEELDRLRTSVESIQWRVANRLSKLGQKNQNSTLQSISITSQAVTMTWNVTR